MISTCFMAFWMSNTATAVMMMPMAISVAALLMPTGSKNTAFAKALVLGIAYASAIGGLGTFVGTPTNAMLQGFMAKTYGTEITLLTWMSFGIPIVLVVGIFAWGLLTRLFLRHAEIADDAHSLLENEFSKLGKMQHGEKLVAMVFLVCVALWIFGGYLESGIGISLSDAGIAIFGALLLFLIPLNFRNAEFVLTWKDAERLPWGILIFFGGSLSLSAAMTSTGVTAWLGAELSVFSGLSLWLIVLGVVLMIILVSELMSNVATIAAFLPILAGLADGMQVHPLMVLVPATLAASCGFMMPGASAANAIAFSTGYLRSGEMVRAGLWLNLAAALMITVICLLLLPLLV
jgi:sodium-dependent dicarboxylate transporter 2/3/5